MSDGEQVDQQRDASAARPGGHLVTVQTGISKTLLLEWANIADRMRIRGVGRQYAKLLHEAGVDVIQELRTRNAENLAAKMQ